MLEHGLNVTIPYLKNLIRNFNGYYLIFNLFTFRNFY